MAINFFDPSSKKLTVYSDFDVNISRNLLTNDLAMRTNEDAVKQSIKMLILTNKGERLFQPTVGSDVRQSLFDNMTPATIQMIEENVRATINNFEPRATIVSVEVVPHPDSYTVEVKVTFYVRNPQSPVSVTVFLERVR